MVEQAVQNALEDLERQNQEQRREINRSVYSDDILGANSEK